MNNFTKEELKLLMEGMNHHLMNDFSLIGEKVLNKIESMIDNYCEHDWRKGVHLFNGVYCTKCTKHFEVNNKE